MCGCLDAPCLPPLQGKLKKKERDVLMNDSDLQSNDYLVVASEKSILVLKLPSQNSYARQKVFDNTYYLKSQASFMIFQCEYC